MEKNRTTRTVVLGLGNMLMADDGVGLAALARLRDEWCLPPHVELVDGGTWGMNLLHVVEGADRLLIFDAISQGGTPGSLIRLEGTTSRASCCRRCPRTRSTCGRSSRWPSCEGCCRASLSR
jgi:hydrogenase maturation protease